jgi:RNA polymerase sigma-70 factor (sigma-E family)
MEANPANAPGSQARQRVQPVGFGSSEAPADGADARGVTAEDAVSALYREHAVGLIRLAVVMLGDTPTAEDIVQEAFLGLYQHWDRLADTSNALRYVRSSVLNGCRSAFRRRARRERPGHRPSADSAESVVLIADEHNRLLTAMRRLPRRQREALVLRFYLELGEQDIAMSMGVSRGTVKSTTSRALAALGRLLQEDQ